MPYEIDDQHYVDVLTLNALDRYDYFTERVAQNDELWTLKTDEGFVTIENGDDLPAIPFWPHPRYAEARIPDLDEGCELFRIDLEKFLSTWLPGMKEEGRKTVVFPLAGAESVFIEAAKLRRDLYEERRGDGDK